MSFYFDAEWFEQKMADLRLTHKDLAQRLSITMDVLWAIWRGEQALNAYQVRALATLLAVGEVDVRRHAGLAPGQTGGQSVPLEPMRVLDDPEFAARFRAMERRLDTLEDRLYKLMRHMGCSPD